MPTISKVKPVLGPQRRTNPLIWCAAIICSILAVAVIITGLIVFIGYMAIRPKVPTITVSAAHLYPPTYSQDGVLAVRLSIIVRATNENLKAHASFYETSFILGLSGLEIAQLRADPFDVSKNSSIEFDYLVESGDIPLGEQWRSIVDDSLQKNLIRFELKGNSRTRWRIGFVGSIKFWLHLNCNLNFFVSNGSVVDSTCSSKHH